MKLFLLVFLLFTYGENGENDVASGIPLSLIMGSELYATQLKNSEPDTYIIRGRQNNIAFDGAYQTLLTIKRNNNLNYNFVVQPVYDTTDAGHFWGLRMDVGFSIYTYGNMEETLYQRVKKIRIYPENNIYTEKIELKNGFELIIEKKVYVREVLYKGEVIGSLADYEFE